MKKKVTKKASTQLNDEKVEEIKVMKRAVVDGKDAVVLINIFSPDHEPKEFKVRIPKIINNCSPPHRDPKYIAGVIVGSLKKKYGDKVN